MCWSVRPGIGLGGLLFGSSRDVVRRQFGEPEDVEEDLLTGDPRVAWYYREQGLSAHFDGEDDFRLGSLTLERQDAELHGHRLVGRPEAWVRSILGGIDLGTAEFELLEFSDHPSLGWLRYADWGLGFWFEHGRLKSIQWTPLIQGDEFVWPEIVD